MHIKSTKYRIWLITTIGDIPIPRPKTKCIEADLAIMELNTKACYTLTCDLSRNEYNNIYKLKITKEIWNLLLITYEGT